MVKLEFWQNRVRNNDYYRCGLPANETLIYSYLDSSAKVRILGLSAKTEQSRREQRSLYKMLARRLGAVVPHAAQPQEEERFTRYFKCKKDELDLSLVKASEQAKYAAAQLLKSQAEFIKIEN